MIRQTLLFSLLFFGLTPYAKSQANVYAFYEYSIKNGQENAFINGYRADLDWQKTQRDTWSWIGWFVLNGPRRDRFIDATPDHQWKDFDNWVVDRGENARHNEIHFVPYVGKPSGTYRLVLSEYSLTQPAWYKSPLVQVYHVTLKFGQEKEFQTFLSSLKIAFGKAYPSRSFICMKTVSGDYLSSYCLLITSSRNEELTALSNLFEPLIRSTYTPADSEQILQRAATAIATIQSELWGYRSDLSMYP